MANRGQYRRALRPAWHAWVCVLVIGLVLYNPFVGLFHAGDSLGYEKLARNRATVGSSELQHFCPVQNGADHARPDLEVDKNGSEPAKTPEQSHFGIVQCEASPVRAEFLAGLWFRPPPAQ